jgi:tetratricopeptide (TPR) repeat protein
MRQARPGGTTVKKGIFQFGVVALALAICIAFGLTSFAPPASAQDKNAAGQAGTIKGTVKDEQSKPLPDVTVKIQPDGGVGLELETKTDAAGKYSQGGLAAGIYDLTYIANGEILYRGQTKVVAGHEVGINLNLSDPDVKNYRERAKAYSEEMKKANTLKAHFDLGRTMLEQATEFHKQALRAPSDQRAELQAKVIPLATQAITELQAALTSLGEKIDENRRAIYSNIGEAYDDEEKYDEEAQILQKAAEIDPPSAPHYNNLGNALAKAGKITEARAAYDKSAELDPASAPQAYRNLAVVLYNSGQLQSPGIVDMMKKATQLDPNSAQGWFLLGAALAANIQAKQEGEKIVFTLLPGTVEAYQKCLDLNPNGPLAAQARQGLEELKAMGVGIDTKVTAPKVKH